MGRTPFMPVVVCVLSLAAAARADQTPADAMGMHRIEIEWHTAQTTKNIPQMMALFTDDARWEVNGKTLAGKAQIEQFWRASPVFKPQNDFVAYTPPARFRYDTSGDTGHVYFECLQIDRARDRIVPDSHVGVSADVVRVDGTWLIKDAKGTELAKP